MALGSCEGDHLTRATEHVARGALELVPDVQVGGRDERVNAGARRRAHGTRGALDVAGVGARECGDDRCIRKRADLARDRVHGLPVARRGSWKTGFDDIDVQSRELVSDEQFLGDVHRASRRLLAVA